MNILDIENRCIDLSDENDFSEEIWFSILDFSDPVDPDFKFSRLIFIEEFEAPVIILSISNIEVSLPYNWYIAVGCSDNGGPVEVVPISSIQSQEFDVFTYNPMASFRHEYLTCRQIGYSSERTWVTPRIGDGQLLSIPIHSGDSPPCIFVSPTCDSSNDEINIWELL